MPVAGDGVSAMSGVAGVAGDGAVSVGVKFERYTVFGKGVAKLEIPCVELFFKKSISFLYLSILSNKLLIISSLVLNSKTFVSISN